jgi:hypothetical protein
VVKLYLDEDVPESIAHSLRLRGYNVVTTKEAKKRGLSDIVQLKYAASQGRAIFSFNRADFCKLHAWCLKKGIAHEGIILSEHLPIGVIVKALLKLLSKEDATGFKNKLIWLSSSIKQIDN